MEQQLLDYVRQAMEQGQTSETIRKVLLDAGWDVNTVNDAFSRALPKAVGSAHPLAPPAAKVVRRYNPWLIAASNFIFPSGAYLVLKRYGRLYVSLVLLALTSVMAPFASYLVIFAVAADSFRLARAANEGKPQPPKNRALSVIGVMAIAACIGVVAALAAAPSMFVRSATACKIIYAMNSQAKASCLNKAGTSQLLQDYQARESVRNVNGLSDQACDAYLKDASLSFSNGNFQRHFRDVCYEQKALETKNGKYCLSMESNSDDCLSYLAASLNDPTYCDFVADYSKASCQRVFSIMDEPLHSMARDTALIGVMSSGDCSRLWGPAVSLCEARFGAFYASIKAAYETRNSATGTVMSATSTP